MRSTRGFSLIGLLITMVCIVVLMYLLMSSMNTAVTGAGNTLPGTVHSVKDELHLASLFRSIMANARDNGGSYLVPSEVDRSRDASRNTTASLYSAMIAQNYIRPEDLISANERSGYVQECFNYNFQAYQPAQNKFWDPNFKADLQRGSNVSFAHMPLIGDRFRQNWSEPRMDSGFALVGNRGPKDGINNPQSLTYGRDGTWAGHIVFGDGHVEFINTFSPRGDNLFAMEKGPQGGDAILAFTPEISSSTVTLQFD